MWERRTELEGFARPWRPSATRRPGLAGRAIAGPHAYDQIPASSSAAASGGRFHADLDALLADRPFVAGEAYSVADITARVTLDFAAGALSMPTPDTAVSIARWYEAVSERPSAEA
jgi:glutathione S-transferase